MKKVIIVGMKTTIKIENIANFHAVQLIKRWNIKSLEIVTKCDRIYVGVMGVVSLFIMVVGLLCMVFGIKWYVVIPIIVIEILIQVVSLVLFLSAYFVVNKYSKVDDYGIEIKLVNPRYFISDVVKNWYENEYVKADICFDGVDFGFKDGGCFPFSMMENNVLDMKGIIIYTCTSLIILTNTPLLVGALLVFGGLKFKIFIMVVLMVMVVYSWWLLERIVMMQKRFIGRNTEMAKMMMENVVVTQKSPFSIN